MELDIQQVARSLHTAEQQRKPIAPLSETYPALNVEQAYAIQSAWHELKQSSRQVGHKIGLTSLPMQKLLGIDQPDYGFLLENMVVTSGSVLRRSDFIAPRIEPEIAFWLAEDLRGPGLTAEDVLKATSGVSAALELVDSRVANWKIKLVDTIADNASSAHVIISEKRVDPRELDLVTEQVDLLRNEQRVGQGTGEAVLGHPATAVAWLANKLAEFDVTLRRGQFILPGAMCAAPDVSAGETYRATFRHLGNVIVHFV